MADNTRDIEAGIHEESLAVSPDSLERLRSLLDGHVSVFLGPSGVGKSTLVNALTGAQRATGGVNDVTGRGRHTSTSAIALRLPDASGWVVDTPGVRSFGLAHVRLDGIVAHFPDLEPGTADCPRGCTHDEEECGLDPWVTDGHAGPAGRARLDSLRRLLCRFARPSTRPDVVIATAPAVPSLLVGRMLALPYGAALTAPVWLPLL